MATSSKDRRARRLELTKRADRAVRKIQARIAHLTEADGCRKWRYMWAVTRQATRKRSPSLLRAFPKKAPPAWLSALFQKGDAWGRCFPRHFLVERGWFSGTRFEDKKLRSTPLRRGRKPVASAQKRSPLRKEIYEISMIVVFPIVFFKVFPLICPLFWLFQAPHPRCCGLAASRAPAQTRASNASPDGLHRCQDAQRFEFGE